eukprot:6403800-Prymnesium_polylepis.1
MRSEPQQPIAFSAAQLDTPEGIATCTPATATIEASDTSPVLLTWVPPVSVPNMWSATWRTVG